MTLPYMISMATPISSGHLVLYYTVILLYYNYSFNSLIWLTGIVEVVSTCSRQPTLITCLKKYSINNNDNVPCIFLAGSQINININIARAGESRAQSLDTRWLFAGATSRDCLIFSATAGVLKNDI